MKQFLFFLVTTCCLFSEIITTSNYGFIEKELSELEPGTWFVFDVDMTLIIPKEGILRGVAEDIFYNLGEEVDPNFREADKNRYFSIVIRDMEFELMFPEGPDLLKKVQESGATVIALTAMSFGKVGVIPSIADWRIDQLHSFGFAFEKAAPTCNFPTYKKGILFSSRKSKGIELVNFLQAGGFRPKKVIFVDDGLEYVESVDAELKKLHIPCTSYHFTAGDDRPVIFTPSTVRSQIRTMLNDDYWPREE